MDRPSELVAHSILIESYEAVEIVQTDGVTLDEIEVDIIDTLLDLLEGAVEVSTRICVVAEELSVTHDESLLRWTLVYLVWVLFSSEQLIRLLERGVVRKVPKVLSVVRHSLSG